MDLLLKAIRTRLTGDATLTATVAADDITASFIAEDANYPCVVLGIKAGASQIEISGVTKAMLVIDVYSNVTKQQLWTIYDRIKFLLHNQGRAITDASRVIHAIYEVDVSDSQYDSRHDVWSLSAQYTIAYSTTGLSLTTGAIGAIYADPSAVSATPEKEVAKFRGAVSLDIEFESEIRRAQERFGKSVYYHSGTGKLIIEEVIFKASVLNLLWNISANASGTLSDGSTPATVYQLSQGSHPSYLQVLFQMTKTDDGKRLEIEAGKAICHSLKIPFSKKDFSVFNCEWILLGDDNENVVRVAIEN